ncbi:hypothetical protein LTR67_004001 [Exophiala xenobiotica]
MMLLKREKCKNPSADVDICAKYVTTFQTTGIPLIIGLTLFAILLAIMFVIVRKNRKKRKAEEAEKHRNIDDDVELEFNVSTHKQQRYNGQGPQHQHQHSAPDFAPDLENGFEANGPPPKY